MAAAVCENAISIQMSLYCKSAAPKVMKRGAKREPIESRDPKTFAARCRGDSN